MPQMIENLKPFASSESITRCAISCIFVFLTQFSLSLVPRFFSAASILPQIVLAAVVLLVVIGLGGWCRRILRVYASAPAFVFFNVLFVWGIYMAFVRRAVSGLMDVVFNTEVVMLIIGLCSILSSDPGLVTYGSSSMDKLVESSDFEGEAHNKELETSTSTTSLEYPTEGSQVRRARFCRICKAHIKGFDHHCPAFGNCIGQNNYVLFLALLVGFLITEGSFVVCSSEVANESQILDSTMTETSMPMNLVISTRLFSILQLAWQGVFLTWHIYCVCMNITTDEWINWMKYPEFQLLVHSQPGQNITSTGFRNPHDKGVIQNLKEFLSFK